MQPYDHAERGPFPTQEEAQKHADELNSQNGGAPFLVDLGGEAEPASYLIGRQDDGDAWIVTMVIEAQSLLPGDGAVTNPKL